MKQRVTITFRTFLRIGVVVLLLLIPVMSRPKVVSLSQIWDDSLSSDLFTLPVAPENFYFEETQQVTRDGRTPPPRPFSPILQPDGAVVRIALAQNRRDLQFFCDEPVVVHSGGQRIKIPRGEVRFSVTLGGLLVRAQGKSRELMPPCSLVISNKGTWEYADRRYAGMAVVDHGAVSGISLTEVVSVETYLRGVVPLEIGGRSQSQIEALKAQAVAARTYTYKRMAERKTRAYDLLPTVADQVYGGVGVANQYTDAAIQATAGEVMLFGGGLVSAYYHSTCGGNTASIEEVWNSKPIAYLRSVPDMNSEGKSWCSHSAKYRWTESWSVEELSTILRNHTKGLKENLFQGTIHEITVLDCSEGGRIRQCRVVSNMGTYYYGKDLIRQYFRRTDVGNSIQWSSSFTLSREGSRYIAQGKGFGHGIGLCQIGALGRAAGGQTYRDILRSYYLGVQVAQARNREEQTPPALWGSTTIQDSLGE